MAATFSWTLLEDPAATDPTTGVAADGSARVGGAALRDFLLGSDGDLVITHDLQPARGVAAIAQAIRIKLRLYLGEWFEDESKGTPYYEAILVKAPSVPAIRSLIRERIEGTAGVAELVALEVDYRPEVRSLSVTLDVRADTGELVRIRATES